MAIIDSTIISIWLWGSSKLCDLEAVEQCLVLMNNKSSGKRHQNAMLRIVTLVKDSDIITGKCLNVYAT